MRKTILALAIAALLGGCATSQPFTPVAATSRGTVTGFATIAQWGTWEMELAPAYTRVAALAHRAAAELDSGRLNAAVGERVRDLLRQAKDSLDASRRTGTDGPTDGQRELLAAARRHLDAAASLLER